MKCNLRLCGGRRMRDPPVALRKSTERAALQALVAMNVAQEELLRERDGNEHERVRHNRLRKS